MSSTLKVDILQDSGGNNIISSNGSGDLTIPTGKLSGHMYPAFFAHLSNEQNVSDATFTKLQCDTEIMDIGGYYDNTTNYRYTPLVAGKYFVFGAIHLDATAGNYIDGQVEVRKNGTKLKYVAGRAADTASAATEFTIPVKGIVDMNGTTDYLELWGYLNINSGSSDFEDDFGTSFGAYRIGD